MLILVILLLTKSDDCVIFQ